jgi:SAM-dependent methyltransferase
MDVERDYVLGTHDDEVARLGLQHRLWRSRVLEAWQRAGFAAGQTLLDVGCGPGWATLDLAEIVGPAGRVIAIDRSRRFLDTLDVSLRQRGIAHVTTHEQDLDDADLPDVRADGAWCRWVFAFVQRPRHLLARVAARLRPGGRFVALEYFDYSTFRLAPRSPEFESFVQSVIRSWRANGGEPDVGLDLPGWLVEAGFEIEATRPHVHVVPPSSVWWQWPKTFVDVGLRRLLDLGIVTADEAVRMQGAFTAAETTPGACVVTPAALEIVAVRR